MHSCASPHQLIELCSPADLHLSQDGCASWSAITEAELILCHLASSAYGVVLLIKLPLHVPSMHILRSILGCCLARGLCAQVTLPTMKFSSALQYNTITAASAQSPPPQPKVTGTPLPPNSHRWLPLCMTCASI